jgi:hypothetical protein
MAVSIPTGGAASVASSTSTTTTISVTVPSVAQAGDILLIAGMAERAEIPTVRLNNATTGLVTGRSESSVNISVLFAWKRLTSADLNGSVAVFNTAARRQAIGLLLVRGAQDPVFSNHPFDGQSSTESAKTPGTYTPAANSSLVVSTWAIARVITPYTGYTFSSSAPWAERIEKSGTYASAIEPTIYLTTNQLGTGTAGVPQANVTVTSTTTSWDSITSTVVFAPSAAANPTARASVIQPIAEINATGSTTGAGGTLTYSISPSAGVSQPDPGIFLVPYTNSPQTFTITVSETGGGSSTVQATVPAAPSSGTITNTTGVETVRFTSGAWI